MDRDQTEEPVATCSHCSTRIDSCAFCQRDDCPRAICFRCLRQELEANEAARP